jgi:hypothetical protein
MVLRHDTRRRTMSANSFSPLGVETTVRAAINALKTMLPADKEVSVDGEPMTVGALIDDLNEIQTLYGGVRDLAAKLRELIAKRRAHHAKVVAFLHALRATLVSLYGLDAVELTQFGFQLRKKAAPLTSEQKVVKAAKLRETRKLRHTLGSRQKAAIKATGPVTVSVTMPEDTTLAGYLPPAPDPAAARAPAPTPVPAPAAERTGPQGSPA